jgi:hypothetical protein
MQVGCIFVRFITKVQGKIKMKSEWKNIKKAIQRGVLDDTFRNFISGSDRTYKE